MGTRASIASIELKHRQPIKFWRADKVTIYHVQEIKHVTKFMAACFIYNF